MGSPTIPPSSGPIFRKPASPAAVLPKSETGKQGPAPAPGPTSVPVSAAEAEIDILIRSRYPIIYVLSFEEDRVESLLTNIARNQNKQCYSWSVTRGMLPTGTDLQSKTKVVEATRDPMEAMNSVLENLENALFIFKDFHPFLNDPAIIRRLRELSSFLRDSPRTFLIVSPVLKIPCELEKEITVVDFGYPLPADLNRKLDEMISVMKADPRVKINLGPEDRESLIKACSGLTLREVENVLSKTLISKRKLDGDDLSAILSEKEQIIRKSGILEFFSSNEDFGNVGGLEYLKEWLKKRVGAYSEKARAFGCTPPKGLLLLGVQGCGKSLVAKAVSSLWKVPLLRLDVGRIFSNLVGSSEENARRAIKTAESVAPAILWIDEIEKAFGGVVGSVQGDSGAASRVFATFITWMQEKTAPVFVIATSNRIKDLPPELFRKGRFDDIFFVDLPGMVERKEIFTIHITRRRRDPALFDLEFLARSAEGFSGAEIEEAISSAIYEAFHLGEELSTPHIVKALGETCPLSKTMREEIDKLRIWARERARPASVVGPAGIGKMI